MDKSLEIPGYKLSLNSLSNGNGIAAYLNCDYTTFVDICRNNYQISAYRSNERVVINVYCSSKANHNSFLDDLLGLINNNISDHESIIIAGDFNISFWDKRDNIVIKKLKENNFSQIVTKPTHNQGHLLDHIYIRSTKCQLQVVHQSIVWFDHDVLHVISQ